jgi:hypothetical protein
VENDFAIIERPMMARWSWGAAIATIVACGCSSSSGTSAPAPPTPRATGDLLEWQAMTTLTTARANHCSVAVDGWLVVIGGNYKPAGAKDFKNLDDVLAAKIAADGTLGDWQLAGKTPLPVNSCTATADGSDLYLVDGIFDDPTADPASPPPNKVRRATLGKDGTLAPWQELGALPDKVRVLYSLAAIDHGALRAFHARLPDEGDAVSIVRAPLDPASGDLGQWAESDFVPGFRGHPQYAYAKRPNGASLIYALGGYASADSANGVLADGMGAALDANGVPGKPFAVASLPKPTSFGQAASVDDWIFVVGGKDEVLTGKGRPDVFAAHVEADGTLGAFATVASLPQGRTSHAVAIYGDWLYVTGGGYDAGGLDTVFGAKVRFTPPAPR